MSDPTAEFFASLSRRRHEPLLAEAAGTMRFDLDGDGGVERWYLVINHGDLRVSRDESRYDTLVRADKRLFEDLITGRAHIYASWVRNDLRASGDVRLARLMQRLMPGPPGSRHPRAFVQERRRRATAGDERRQESTEERRPPA